MLHDFYYVPRKDYLPMKLELEKLIHAVQNEVRTHFTFSYTYIGSTRRKLITNDRKGNTGFDFDVNIHVNDKEQLFSAKEIRMYIKDAINKYALTFGYDFCEDSTRVLTIKRKDRINSRILFSCDFALVRDCEGVQQQYIHFDKSQNSYHWEYLPMSDKKLEKQAERIKKHKHWDDVKKLYLTKKNNNNDPDRKSRSIYAETINEVFQKLK